MSSKVFRGIWYRSEPSKKLTYKNALDRERGSFFITDKKIIFKNEKVQLEIRNIEKISFGLQGMDPINSWIKITYQQDKERKEAFFADGKMFGYFGFFGASWRIFKSLGHLVDTLEINDRRHIKNKIYLVLAFLFLLMKILE